MIPLLEELGEKAKREKEKKPAFFFLPLGFDNPGL
jgi:hypothetical protein